MAWLIADIPATTGRRKATGIRPMEGICKRGDDR
jgi:hypothetical protein